MLQGQRGPTGSEKGNKYTKGVICVVNTKRKALRKLIHDIITRLSSLVLYPRYGEYKQRNNVIIIIPRVYYLVCRIIEFE